MSHVLYYAHDPMCSWCWGFRPAWEQLRADLSPEVQIRYLLGGLAPDTDQAMEPDMQRYLRQTWQRIQQRIPATEFNFAFWDKCRPRRSTYPACRAVIAARHQDPLRGPAMILAIQQAYYLQARNPSDKATLVELAMQLDLDIPRFLQDIGDPGTQMKLEQEIIQARSLGLGSFPSLCLETGGSRWPIAVDYTNPAAMGEQIGMLI